MNRDESRIEEVGRHLNWGAEALIELASDMGHLTLTDLAYSGTCC